MQHKVTPIIGIDNMDKLNLQVFQRKTQPIIKENTANCKIEEQFTKLLSNHYKVFNRNSTVQNFKDNVKFKVNFYPLQQRRRIVPIHLQSKVKIVIDKLIKNGQVLREKVGEDHFFNPVVTTNKNN